jgi:hypothetical protein
MFYITLVFGIAYLPLYPGLGTFKGYLGWTSTGGYEEEVKVADTKFGALFKQFQTQDIVTLSKDPKAQKMGERLFASYCSTCQGSDARGARGFPDLRDDDWLWGARQPISSKQSSTAVSLACLPGVFHWAVKLVYPMSPVMCSAYPVESMMQNQLVAVRQNLTCFALAAMV